MVGELNGVVGEIEQYLAQTQRVAHQGQGDIRSRVEKNFQVLFPGFDGYQIGQVFQNIFQVKLDGFNVELSGFNFGKIQDIVDDPEQGIGPGLDFLNVVFLFRGHLRLKGQMGHADNRIHRGPDFVTHVGQKIAFSLIGLIGNLFGFD